ncbi:MAG TPA: hypothetical protein VF247_03740 [Candidatus Krumholzibacteria bacterium]
MRSLLVFLAAFGLLVSGCAKKESGQAAGDDKAKGAAGMMPDTTAAESHEVIPNTDVPETPVEGLTLNPYFDEAGTQSEISVGRGEQFKLYIMAQTVDPYETLSAQLRLEMPPGINVLYTVETPKKLSSLGKYDFNYMVAFDCTPPGRFVVVSYVCQTDQEFKGGVIHVLPGFLADNASFLGFATCEFNEVRAAGGEATLRLKT